jgi:hypothetical protein
MIEDKDDMRLSRTTWTMIVLVLSAGVAGGCGDDKSDSGSEAGAGGTSRAGTGGAGAKTEPCGSKNCEPPEDGTAEACCMDSFSSTCGFKMPGGACAPAIVGDPRCPSVSVAAGITLPSCCTDDGQCGIDATMFTMPGCVDLATAAERAKTMGGGMISFPEPRACGDAKK